MKRPLRRWEMSGDFFDIDQFWRIPLIIRASPWQETIHIIKEVSKINKESLPSDFFIPFQIIFFLHHHACLIGSVSVCVCVYLLVFCIPFQIIFFLYHHACLIGPLCVCVWNHVDYNWGWELKLLLPQQTLGHIRRQKHKTHTWPWTALTKLATSFLSGFTLGVIYTLLPWMND